MNLHYKQHIIPKIYPILLLLLLLSDLGNARVIMDSVLLIETITPIYVAYWFLYTK